MDKGECRRSTGTNFGTFIVFDLHKRFAKRLQSNPKLFPEDTFLFSTVQDVTTSTVSLNNDLTKCTVQWKMNFNPDPRKQAQELPFSRKTSSKPYPSLNF